MHICHLCHCQERLKAMLTYAYVKIVLISTNIGIFFNMTYVKVSSTSVKISLNICES